MNEEAWALGRLSRVPGDAPVAKDGVQGAEIGFYYINTKIIL